MLFLRALFLLAILSVPAAASANFEQWVSDFKQRALAQGIPQGLLDDTLDGLPELPRVIELDRRQPGQVMSFVKYRQNIAPSSRINKAKDRYSQNRSILEQVSNRYSVDPGVIVALWGVESDFGRNPGTFPIISALATLAYEGRRGEFFEKELLAALQIVAEGHIDHQSLQGSWAGAMGQVQFMPSTFLHYAEDFDQDGRKDIWNNIDDALASAANYLSRSGWKQGQSWGGQAQLPESIDENLIGLDHLLSLKEWRNRGVKLMEGGDALEDAQEASLILPDGPSGPAFLVFENYRVLRRWNRSTSFALTVGYLADQIVISTR